MIRTLIAILTLSDGSTAGYVLGEFITPMQCQLAGAQVKANYPDAKLVCMSESRP